MKASTPRPVLIVASDSDGHRQNYVAVLGRWFAEAGHSVVIACGSAEDGLPASQTPILAQFLAKSGAGAIDLEKDIVQERVESAPKSGQFYLFPTGVSVGLATIRRFRQVSSLGTASPRTVSATALLQAGGVVEVGIGFDSVHG
jgi:hypothetical protein